MDLANNLVINVYSIVLLIIICFNYSRFDSCGLCFNYSNKYNKLGSQPYRIGFSMGYAVYDYHSHMKVEEFQKQIDRLMDENKQANRA